jgi:hypothetical protein
MSIYLYFVIEVNRGETRTKIISDLGTGFCSVGHGWILGYLIFKILLF